MIRNQLTGKNTPDIPELNSCHVMLGHSVTTTPIKTTKKNAQAAVGPNRPTSRRVGRICCSRIAALFGSSLGVNGVISASSHACRRAGVHNHALTHTSTAASSSPTPTELAHRAAAIAGQKQVSS
ncbi:MAG: hypothetical protein N2689_17290 [Verrucomicrobiae bacterium]|nr:hypothetical protein [Verrucomicrobiae bacterium]